jgi:hypothetical protein
MNVSSYSKRCIEKYLDKYNISLGVSEKFEKYDNVEGVMTISTKHDPAFGEFEYYFNGEELFIKRICIKEIKHDLPIKLLKVFLLYLLAMYTNNAKYVKLIVDPEYNLSDYYKQLGFEPDINLNINSTVKVSIKALIPKLKKALKSAYKEITL